MSETPTPAVRAKMQTAAMSLPPKPALQSTTLYVQGGGAIFFVFTLLSYFAKKFFHFELPFSFEDFSAAIAALIGAVTTIYAIWKRIKHPIQQPIEGTAASGGA